MTKSAARSWIALVAVLVVTGLAEADPPRPRGRILSVRDLRGATGREVNA
jgi:hypothetical protein